MKRSNGEGTIYKRKDGRWCAAFYDESPNPRRHFVYGTTQTEVKKKLRKKKENLISEDTEKKDSYTLEGWILYYLENYKKNDIKQTTFDTYMSQYNKHIRGTNIGKKDLEQITSDEIQRFYNDQYSNGYNAKTVKHIYILVNAALKKAVQLKLIKENVNSVVVLPKTQSFEGKMLSVLEVNKVINQTRNEELYPIIVLTIYTGLRKGEIMALKWEHVNFEEKELYVEGSLCRVVKEKDEKGSALYEYRIMSPKTAKSRRVIPLTDIAIGALLLQKERQEKMKLQNHLIYKDQGFVFARYDGRYLEQRGFMDQYHEFLKRYKISDIRFHDLRHTFASLLLEAGESPKVIQELLGHSTITTTLDIYAHVTRQTKVKATSKLDKMLGNDSGKIEELN